MESRRASIEREADALDRLKSRALASWRFRPLLWLVLAAVAGVWAGKTFVFVLCGGDLSLLTRFQGALWAFFPLVWCGVALAFWGRPASWRRAGVGLALAAFFAFYCAQRLVAPRGDVSQWSKIAPANGPLKAPEVRVRGIVGDYVRRGDFASQFPLQVSAIAPEKGEMGRAFQKTRGNIWVSASPYFPARVGDEVEFNTRLFSLQTPTNPGQSSGFWSNIGVSCWSRARGAEVLVVRRAGVAFPVARRIEEVRSAIYWRYQKLFHGQTTGPFRQNHPFAGATAQLLTAMVWGEGGLAQPLPRQIREEFRVAGLSHLLVASGTQVGIFCLGLGWILRRVIPHRGLAAALLIGGVTFYALLAGSAPSIWRAAIVGFFGIWAVLAGREVDWFSLLCGALLLLLFLDPLSAWSVSLQLSFGAAWGLTVLMPPLARFFSRWLGTGGAQLLGACLAAQWGTLPISLSHFGAWGVLSIGSNLLILPISAGLVIFGALALALPFLAWPLYWLTRAIAFLVHQVALLPGASAQVAPVKIGVVAVCYGLSLMSLWFFADDLKKATLAFWPRFQNRARSVNLWPFSAALLLLSAFLTWRVQFPPAPRLRAWVFDVGQGHATLLVSPQGRAVLVDGGTADDRGEVGAAVLVPALQALGVSTLDALILTGRDSKSCAGLPALLREVGVARIFDGTRTPQFTAQQARNDVLQSLALPFYSAVLSEAKRQKIPVQVPSDGQKWRLDAMTLQFLQPRNNNALAVRASFGARQNAILVAHNLDASQETRLLKRPDLRSTVLVGAQNGAEKASSLRFLWVTAPRAVVFSTGRFNSEETPAPTVLKRCAQLRAPVFRTDLHGAIQVSCAPNECTIRPTREVGSPTN